MDEIDKELEQLLDRTPLQSYTAWDSANILGGIILLTKSVRTLDRTSSRLATIYIWLTVILGIIGIVQIVLMLRGH